jgi:hypothetical protein
VICDRSVRNVLAGESGCELLNQSRVGPNQLLLSFDPDVGNKDAHNDTNFGNREPVPQICRFHIVSVGHE